MYIRTVTFSITVDPAHYAAHAEKVAPAFTSWPGLHAKWWLADEDANRYGGVYLFASKEAADASRDTEVFRGMAANPAFTDLVIEEYDVLAAPTGVTAPVLH